jgi:hypothetical protein
MKKILFSFFWTFVMCNINAQTNDDILKLAGNDDFINFVSSTSTNQIKIQKDFKNQLQSNYSAFWKTLKTNNTNDEVEATISQFQLNPEISTDLMAEHLAYQYIFLKNNPWVMALSTEQQRNLILAAYDYGIKSDDFRWKNFRDAVLSEVDQTVIGGQNKSMPEIVLGCVRETVEDAFNIGIEIGLVVLAVQDGSLSATVTAIKKLLKKLGKRFGWFGLAIAAWDIGWCIYNQS